MNASIDESIDENFSAYLLIRLNLVVLSNDVVGTSVSKGFSASESLVIPSVSTTKEVMRALTGSKQKQNLYTHHTEYWVPLTFLLGRKELQSRGKLVHFLMAEILAKQLYEHHCRRRTSMSYSSEPMRGAKTQGKTSTPLIIRVGSEGNLTRSSKLMT